MEWKSLINFRIKIAAPLYNRLVAHGIYFLEVYDIVQSKSNNKLITLECVSFVGHHHYLITQEKWILDQILISLIRLGMVMPSKKVCIFYNVVHISPCIHICALFVLPLRLFLALILCLNKIRKEDLEYLVELLPKLFLCWHI